MPLGWGGEKGVEARLDAELLAAAVQILQHDGKERKMGDLFTEALSANHKLAYFFRASDTNDKAHFNALFKPAVMAENHIVKTCGNPVKYQYQG